jgi:hypothetical protein
MIAIKLAHSHTHIPYSCFPNSGGGEEGSFGTLHFRRAKDDLLPSSASCQVLAASRQLNKCQEVHWLAPRVSG